MVRVRTALVSPVVPCVLGLGTEPSGFYVFLASPTLLEWLVKCDNRPGWTLQGVRSAGSGPEEQNGSPGPVPRAVGQSKSQGQAIPEGTAPLNDIGPPQGISAHV